MEDSETRYVLQVVEGDQDNEGFFLRYCDDGEMRLSCYLSNASLYKSIKDAKRVLRLYPLTKEWPFQVKRVLITRKLIDDFQQ